MVDELNIESWVQAIVLGVVLFVLWMFLAKINQAIKGAYGWGIYSYWYSFFIARTNILSAERRML